MCPATLGFSILCFFLRRWMNSWNFEQSSRVCCKDCSNFRTFGTGSRPKQGYLFGMRTSDLRPPQRWIKRLMQWQPHGRRQGGWPAHLWHTVLANFCRWKGLQHWALESRNRCLISFIWWPYRWDRFYFHALALAVLYIFSVKCRSTCAPKGSPAGLQAQLNSTSLMIRCCLPLVQMIWFTCWKPWIRNLQVVVCNGTWRKQKFWQRLRRRVLNLLMRVEKWYKLFLTKQCTNIWAAT